MGVHVLIYDRSNNDSLCCAALQTYYIKQKHSGEPIEAYNWDEIPWTVNTIKETIRERCSSITLCATVLHPAIMRTMYAALTNTNDPQKDSGFLSIQRSPVFRDYIIKQIGKGVNQIFNERPVETQLVEDSVHNRGQSAILSLYKYEHPNTTEIPEFYKYLDGFVCDSYYEFGLKRDEVISFDKGLSEIYHNDYNELCGLFETDAPVLEQDMLTKGEKILNDTNNYILNYYKKYGGDMWECYDSSSVNVIYKNGERTNGIVRKVLPLFTCEKLSEKLLRPDNNDNASPSVITDKYDSIVTFNRLKTGDWEMSLYKIMHTEPENPETIEDERIVVLNTFNTGIYMRNKYGGYGNDIYGYAIISEARFRQILGLKSL